MWQKKKVFHIKSRHTFLMYIRLDFLNLKLLFFPACNVEFFYCIVSHIILKQHMLSKGLLFCSEEDFFIFNINASFCDFVKV